MRRSLPERHTKRGILEHTITIQRHIAKVQESHPEASGELSGLLNALAFAGKLITREVRKAGLVDILGLTGRINVQGEQVQKLDMYAHHILVRVVGQSGFICVMASEEEQDVIHLPEGERTGHYAIAFDPLDGSSNIDVNVSIGSIFSIYRRRTPFGPGTADDLLRPGREQVAAGYILYGSSTMMVFSTGDGVHGFTYDPTAGEFLLSHPYIKIPTQGSYYSVNEGNLATWPESSKQFVNYLKESDGPEKRPYSLRYIGSLVADFHRTLLYGGIFMYPPDRAKPEGKLRLVYEAAPLAYLVEQAGGAASNGRGPIRDVVPATLHARTPLYIGSPHEVSRLESYVAEYDGGGGKDPTDRGGAK